jgi:cilia- and flagella-associated protein 57
MLYLIAVCNTTGNAAFMDSGTVVYTAGHNIVLHTIADRKQRFIHGGEGSDGITAMALCPR